MKMEQVQLHDESPGAHFNPVVTPEPLAHHDWLQE